MSDYGKRGHDEMMDNAAEISRLGELIGEEREEAFRSLVKQHGGMVYGCARRIVGDHETAEDVCQAVFVLLFRKASTMKKEVSVAGWLYRTATFVARDTLKLARRRQARDRGPTLAKAAGDPWEELAKHLDAGMGELSDTDRHALLLRFF
ncbi:MAG: sigma-70 family RNA polymerase sigma factor [Verrucomicrobiota bacterium]|mgnify:CR=1 FL=1